MACAHSNLDRFSSCRKRALQGAILVRGHAKDTGRKGRQCQDEGQHDAARCFISAQNLRKAVLHKSKPVGAGAVTNLEEPAHTVKTGAMSDQFSRDPSVIRREDNVPPWYSVRGGGRVKCLTSWEAWLTASGALRPHAGTEEEGDTRA